MSITIENKRHLQRGFTLIEVVIIILLLGILSTTAFPVFQNIHIEAKSKSLRASLYSIREGISNWASKQAVDGGSFSWPSLDTLGLTGEVMLHDFPFNPFQDKNNAPDSIVIGVTKGVIVGDRGGWAYKESTGEIWPNTSSTVPGSGCGGTVPLNENLW